VELLQQLLRWLESNGETGFVVGGAVRDRLLGIAPEELDLALTCSPRAIPVGFWREQGCTGYWLDEKREMLRITTAQGERLDLSQLQGKLEEDLRQRDFTCNALACPVAAWLSGELQLTDPLGGEADLRQGRLRPASPDALLRDPVRVLRGVRLLISRDLSFDDAMAKQLKQAARNVADAPPERISQELGKILLDDEAALGVTYLNSLGVTEVLLPEASAMQGVTQNQYHSFAVDDHSLRAFAAFTEIVQQGKYIPPAVRSAALDYWAALPQPLQVATMLGAWLHDIGKPPTRAIRKGRVTFYGHEQVGAQMIGEVARRLRLSNEQAELMRTFIKYHMYPLQLWRSGHLVDQHAIGSVAQDVIVTQPQRLQLLPGLLGAHQADHLAGRPHPFHRLITTEHARLATGTDDQHPIPGPHQFGRLRRRAGHIQGGQCQLPRHVRGQLGIDAALKQDRLADDLHPIDIQMDALDALDVERCQRQRDQSSYFVAYR
jgi:putative nucleotidyltransferase with HDIG domain